MTAILLSMLLITEPGQAVGQDAPLPAMSPLPAAAADDDVTAGARVARP